MRPKKCLNISVKINLAYTLHYIALYLSHGFVPCPDKANIE